MKVMEGFDYQKHKYTCYTIPAAIVYLCVFAICSIWKHTGPLVAVTWVVIVPKHIPIFKTLKKYIDIGSSMK